MHTLNLCRFQFCKWTLPEWQAHSCTVQLSWPNLWRGQISAKWWSYALICKQPKRGKPCAIWFSRPESAAIGTGLDKCLAPGFRLWKRRTNRRRMQMCYFGGWGKTEWSEVKWRHDWSKGEGKDLSLRGIVAMCVPTSNELAEGRLSGEGMLTVFTSSRQVFWVGAAIAGCD